MFDFNPYYFRLEEENLVDKILNNWINTLITKVTQKVSVAKPHTENISIPGYEPKPNVTNIESPICTRLHIDEFGSYKNVSTNLV